MVNSLRQVSDRKYLRIIFAAAFLFVMLVEWGSHSLAFVHGAQPEGLVAVANEGEHDDDPCKAMVHGGDQRGGQPGPKIAHDLLSQRNAFLTGIELADQFVFLPPLSNLDRDAAHRLFRPIDPPFQPPENS